MAFRGGGRGGGFGRGRGGGGGGRGPGGYVAPTPFILFPEDVQLPDISGLVADKALVTWNNKHNVDYWKTTPYYLEETAPTKGEDIEIERYSDRGKPRGQAKREPLSYRLKLTTANFPRELIQGSKHMQHDQRKVRWNPEPGLDFLQKLEEKFGDQGEKEKKEGEDEDEEEKVETEDEEFSDDGDYNQNRDFDDDEDDFNMDEGEDEATF